MLDPSDPPRAQRALSQPAPPGGRILSFADLLRVVRCPFVSHSGHFAYVSANDPRGASRTTGPKSRHTFRTGLGRKHTHFHAARNTLPSRGPTTTHDKIPWLPRTDWHFRQPASASGQTPNARHCSSGRKKWGIFLARQARDRAFPYYWTFLQPLQTIAAPGEPTILGG